MGGLMDEMAHTTVQLWIRRKPFKNAIMARGVAELATPWLDGGA
jgi:hypothetical protein